MKKSEEKPRPKGRPKKTRRERMTTLIMQAPMTIWAALFIIAPFCLLAFMSFMTKGPLGSIQYTPTLDNYKEILNPVYADVIKQSLVVAGWTTTLTILMGYPLAGFIAKVKSKTSSLLTILLMLPLWVSGLVVLYSFVILLNNSGIINTILMKLHLLKEPLALLYNNFAIVVGMIYMFLPFAVLPMYSSIEKLDPGLIEASKDLGAGPVKTFCKVTLPLTSPGVFAAIILTFIPCIGYYMVTDMLGGGTSLMIGNLIYRQFTISRNWPFGAALSVVLAVIIFLMVFIYTKLGGDLDDLGA
ncbi:ABC transporter permease [Lactonifactor longoviformis]|uniref:Spermidine/putrescine transport system permease protein n=1 Tax=Lactonifactor longoviformis DSM 17459 TaxID=1122155 RepID=A0A1M4STQ9_9CLOT|nr:ABC transporter permease [Lactonifactor longoviformis]POP32889.1 ABC transporter permease [Lactonifactor longoviformis]SHE35644.1 spermidine/putrescine transport system permease protein [Lactonifactor longoviformis DSM 17459]